MEKNNSFIEYNIDIRKRLSNGFCCGNSILDNFLCEAKSLDDKYGKTYVYLSKDKNSIIAYFNITTGSVMYEDGEKLVLAGGSIHLNCFALANEYHGLKIDIDDTVEVRFSDYLLYKCVSIIKDIRRTSVGFSFITLCSTKEGYDMYKRYGFEEMTLDELQLPYNPSEIECTPMYFPLDDI